MKFYEKQQNKDLQRFWHANTRMGFTSSKMHFESYSIPEEYMVILVWEFAYDLIWLPLTERLFCLCHKYNFSYDDVESLRKWAKKWRGSWTVEVIGLKERFLWTFLHVLSDLVVYCLSLAPRYYGGWLKRMSEEDEDDWQLIGQVSRA